MSSDSFTMRIELIEKNIAAMMEEKFIQKINSQEKEIQFLKKNALAQEIKINDIETLLNKWIMTRHYQNGAGELPNNYREEKLLKKQQTWWSELYTYRNRLFENEALCIKEEYEKERKRIEDAAALVLEQKKQEEDKAKTKKALEDMMARVALLEEAADKEELEFQEEAEEADEAVDEADEAAEAAEELEQLRVREAHAVLRAAEIRSAKAKLRGTQKNRASSSSDPRTWSKEKAEQIGKMWCE